MNHVVVDASVVAAALLQDDGVGSACAEVLLTPRLVAPAVLPFEVAQAVRGNVLGGRVPAATGLEALETLDRLPIELWPIGPTVRRVWDLRANLTAYDASYVALAELTGLPLATRDLRLVRASGPRCEFLVPE